MNARAALNWVWSLTGASRVTHSSKPLAEPELLQSEARPMTGLFASLSAEQKQAALNYRGPELVGDESLKRAR